jgi:pimeloyl-ACP methyl ester carboxylesterase
MFKKPLHIVLLHGFCEESGIWNDLLPYLTINNPVHSLDLPGFGKNNELTDLGDSVEAMASWIKNETDKITSEPVILIGHSLGGYIALAFADLYPEKLAGLGLFHSTAYADAPERKEARIKAMEFVDQHGAEVYHRALIPGLFRLNASTAKVERVIEAARSARAQGIKAALGAMRSRPDRTSVLKNFSKPVLLIAGKDDTIIPVDKVMEQAAMCSQAMVEILDKSAHMGMVEQPMESAGIIDRFIRLCEA